MQTTNYTKITTKNPISQFFLNNFYATLLQELRKIVPESILDAGCGEGFTLAKLQKAKIGKKLEGIEYMDEAIQIGKKINPNITIKKEDIYKLPYQDNFFDLVLCTEVLEHLENPEKALLELKRVTKKYVVLTVPNEPYFTISRFLRGKNILGLGAHPEHIQYWTNASFKNFVGRNLQIITAKTPLPWTLILAEK